MGSPVCTVPLSPSPNVIQFKCQIAPFKCVKSGRIGLRDASMLMVESRQGAEKTVSNDPSATGLLLPASGYPDLGSR